MSCTQETPCVFCQNKGINSGGVERKRHRIQESREPARKQGGRNPQGTVWEAHSNSWPGRKRASQEGNDHGESPQRRTWKTNSSVWTKSREIYETGERSGDKAVTHSCKKARWIQGKLYQKKSIGLSHCWLSDRSKVQERWGNGRMQNVWLDVQVGWKRELGLQFPHCEVSG